MTSVMTLDWFQIENLILNNIYFVLLDLRKKRNKLDEPIAFWKMAKAVSEEEVMKQARQLLSHIDQPLILICEDGVLSLKKAEELLAAGFINIYVVEGGSQGLFASHDANYGPS